MDYGRVVEWRNCSLHSVTSFVIYLHCGLRGLRHEHTASGMLRKWHKYLILWHIVNPQLGSGLGLGIGLGSGLGLGLGLGLGSGLGLGLG